MQRVSVSIEHLTQELFAFLTTSMKASQGEVFRVVEEYDLTMTQLKMLHILDGIDHEPTPSEIARIVGLSPAATGRAVDALSRQGIISRREDAEDRRVKRLALTAIGQSAVDRISAARQEGLARLVSSLDPDQRAALSAALAPLLPSHSDCADSPCAEDPR